MGERGMSRLFVKEKSFYKLILSIAVPVVLQNMITIGVNIMDTLMLGNVRRNPALRILAGE